MSYKKVGLILALIVSSQAGLSSLTSAQPQASEVAPPAATGSVAKIEASAMTSRYKINLGGESLTFQAQVGKTHLGLKQVSYILKETKAMVLGAQFVVLVGRDLDGDGRLDTWFFADDVQKPIRETSESVDGWDVAANLLQSHPRLSTRDKKAFFKEVIMNILPVSGAQHDGFNKSLLDEQIDLVSIELRIEALRAQHLITSQSLIIAYELLSDGWGRIGKKVLTFGLGGYAAAILADFTLIRVWMWAADLALATAQKATGFIAERFMATPAGEVLADAFNRLSSSVNEKAAQMAARAARLAPVNLARSATGRVMARMTIPQLEKLILVRDSVARVAIPMARAGARQWDYIVLNLAVQTPIEIWGRRKELYDPKHPERLPLNILKDKDMMQNISYMIFDTALQTSVSSYFPKEQLAKRMVICGFISTADSLAMSSLIKHDADPVRAGLDTIWEASIGNTQTQIDLRSFEILAERMPNSKPRLLGYAVATTDQALGFIGYFFLTKWYEKGPGHDLLHSFFANPLDQFKGLTKPAAANSPPPPDQVMPNLDVYLLPVVAP